MRVTERPVGSVVDESAIAALVEFLRSGESLSFSPVKARFEQAFAASCGAAHAISCHSCTQALYACFVAVGLGPGTQIISTPQTYQNTVLPAVQMGARVRFADIDPATLNMDPAAIEPLINNETKAIVVTHYGGNPAAMGAILEIARQHRLTVIEDAAHAAGASLEGRKVGAIGHMTCFSFHSLKNMTTLGEGGMVTTSDGALAGKLRDVFLNGVQGTSRRRAVRALGPWEPADPPLLDHSAGAYDIDWERIEHIGSNLRMSAAQAAMGLAQLPRLAEFNALRRQVAGWYDQSLADMPAITRWNVREPEDCAYHLYPAFLPEGTSQREHDAIVNHMHHVGGIEMIQRYFPVHLLSVMRAGGHVPGECPRCEETFFTRQLNLPIHPAMTRNDTAVVMDALRQALKSRGLA